MPPLENAPQQVDGKWTYWLVASQQGANGLIGVTSDVHHQHLAPASTSRWVQPTLGPILLSGEHQKAGVLPGDLHHLEPRPVVVAEVEGEGRVGAGGTLGLRAPCGAGEG